MKRVMLVEDEEFILQGIRCIIDWEALSMEVVHMAHNGREALELFRNSPVDIVVTDVEMPFMDGLDFLKAVREQNQRTRCIILSGYDEFEYARSALKLDVDEYILKPINEEKLTDALAQAGKKLDEMDRQSAGSLEDNIGWHRFLKGGLSPEEENAFYQVLPPVKKGEKVYAAILKVAADSLGQGGMDNVLVELQKGQERIKAIYLSADKLFLLLYCAEDCREEEVSALYNRLLDKLESEYGILGFISVSEGMEAYRQLPMAYKNVSRLQKYRMLDGYGSCVNEAYIRNRQSEDVVIDKSLLRKTILKKDKEGAQNYIEDLFINNLKSEVNVDVLYQMALKIAMLLQEIKAEYKLAEYKNLRDLSEMIEKIYQAEDIFGLKTIFISEIVEIIKYLHTEDSQYTPVVKQIMTEVQNNYREDMNLKTLSYKYHMNASYLGQIFQKEVGCSFAQYLSNTKNSRAKDLILNTNMKIHDIAREVGYPDTSYFYRKFKQCYGVSPASLRNMKKY